MLSIKNLHATVANNKILKGLNLEIKAGEVHAIMGRNGTGKSTLANAICGKKGYEIKKGVVEFLSQNINDKSPDEISRMGIFMSLQHPTEIPGVSWSSFLKASINSIRKFQYKKRMNCDQLLIKIKKITNMISINPNLLLRDVNVGFSGGEKKKFEILQMLLLTTMLVM